MAVSRKKRPDPVRVAALRALPLEIKAQITGEEAEAFMYNLELPDSLLEKLKDYLADEPRDIAGTSPTPHVQGEDHERT